MEVKELTLQDIWQQLSEQGIESDKGQVHSYLPVYEEILAPYKDCKRVLEIGIFHGHSLLMWEKYFTKADVHGIDCSDQPLAGTADLRPLIAAGHKISILDATDEKQVEQHFKGLKFDVIVEDASHLLEHQLRIYSIFKRYLNEGGTYIIEDVDKLDEVRHLFENIDSEKVITIFDRRKVKGRFDDVLVVIQ